MGLNRPKFKGKPSYYASGVKTAAGLSVPALSVGGREIAKPKKMKGARHQKRRKKSK